jgi:outer membrane immunogenic protein
MRHHLIAAAFGFLSAAAFPAAGHAADLGPQPVLRGALPSGESTFDWSGLYVGGSGSYSNATNSSPATTSGVPSGLLELTRNTTLGADLARRFFSETRRNQSERTGFGGFVGYNFQYDDVVFGVEADYTRAKVRGNTSASSGGRFNDSAGIDINYRATSTASYAATDFGTLRGRVGYAWGNALPYVTGGLAAFRGSAQRVSRVEGEFIDATTLATISPLNTLQSTNGVSERLYFGYALGAGIDYAFSQNIFMRAEFQHMRFPDVSGFNIQVNTAKVGAGVKF